MEKIPTYTFAFPVQYLRLGDLQLHLFERDTDAPEFHHIGINVDDFEETYRRVKELGILEKDTFFQALHELPDGSVQMYLRDPAGNLVECCWPDVETLDRSQFPRAEAARGLACRRRRKGAARPSISTGRRREAGAVRVPRAGDDRRGGRAARAGQRHAGARGRPEPRAADEVPHGEAERARRRERRRGPRRARGARRRASRRRRSCASSACSTTPLVERAGRSCARRRGTSATWRRAAAARSAARSPSPRRGPS